MKKLRKTIRNPETLSTRQSHKKNILLYDFYLDLHGLTGDAAISRVKSFFQNKHSCTIMLCHGKGEGILRSRIRAFLLNNPRIKNICYGENANLREGDGVTIVDLI